MPNKTGNDQNRLNFRETEKGVTKLTTLFELTYLYSNICNKAAFLVSVASVQILKLFGTKFGMPYLLEKYNF